jgi:hypothetical protein
MKYGRLSLLEHSESAEACSFYFLPSVTSTRMWEIFSERWSLISHLYRELLCWSQVIKDSDLLKYVLKEGGNV